jgi:phosphoglycerate dehydrogenase-like enzyme
MKILFTGSLNDDELANLRDAAPEAEFCVVSTLAAALPEVGDAEIYVPGPWSEEVLRAAKRLRWVHFRWAGVEEELFPEFVTSDVIATNCADIFSIPIAEHVLGMILMFARNLHSSIRLTPADPDTARTIRHEISDDVRELGGATVGIIGFGGIGRAVAERARCLGMRVIAMRRRPEPTPLADKIWGPEGLNELLAQSDYVVISTPLTPETRNLIGAKELALMQPDAVLINVARGAIVDEPALIAALQTGKLRGAGLDVTTEEPLPATSPLWTMQNVILTPHYAGSSPMTRMRQMARLVENLRRYVSGQPLIGVVDKQAGY